MYNMNNLIARFMISYTIINQKEYTMDTIKFLKIIFFLKSARMDQKTTLSNGL